MKTCPKCGELVGDSADKCFNCFFNFNSKEENRKLELEKQRRQRKSIIGNKTAEITEI